MGSREEWCADKLSKLLQEELRISTLNEIKEHFTSIPHQEASRTANVLDLPLVFDCLNDSNQEQVDLACEVLSICLNSLSLGESTNKYDVPLERALNHPFPSVKLMALSEIQRNIHKEESAIDICKRISLYKSILRCIGDEDLSVAQKAAKIISVLGLSDLGLRTLVSSDVVEVLYDIMSTNGIIRLRLYEVAVNVAKESESNFTLLRSTDIIDTMMEELKSNDILLRMNIIEIIIDLGLSPHGFIFLEESGILKELFSVLDDSENPITLELCQPGILKFFGNLAQWRPIEMMSKYPKVVDRIYSNVESSDLTVVKVSLDTIGIIGSSNEGKRALLASGNKITYSIKTIVKLLVALPNEVRLTALTCLENLLRVTDQKAEITKITKQWFSLFGDDPMDIVLRYSKNPFPDIRLAGFGILHAISGQQWGQEAINNTPGLVEFLLDRNSETTKECKEMKYEIVKVLSTSSIFDESISSRLRTFLNEGPYYVQAITEIAIEGDE
ncbi:unnamed protein product [Phaedon cochleariae]|uniref:26S proteasome non-ATPase regulatory subunit 5 n=1 Tax=Phaedon cochleariae TaxID=80249 RepID=A0A9N9SMI7_PHACE|nr:unnamed protein product [Phaedon cochleariae]